jgi:adenylate cyclase, class 2
MSFEVELKFRVPDLAAFSRMLAERCCEVLPAQHESDLYFAHPARDFAQTDEALRLRQKGDANFITYKGPKIDATTKTRREIELPLAAGRESFQLWKSLLEAVGFRAVAEVHKSRRKATVPWQGRRVELSLDEVQDVGTYVEFELVVDEADLDAARACIVSLAQSFHLVQGERRSYLELLLENHVSRH